MEGKSSQIYDGISSYGSFSPLNSFFRMPLAWRFTRAPAGVEVFFTTRRGGASAPPFDSLNLGFHVGDNPELVIRNRTTVSEICGFDPASITAPRQRHTGAVRLVEQEKEIGAGADREESVFDPCDGLVTAFRYVPLLLNFADCLPVVLATGAPRPAVAVLHAGRRGLMEGVIAGGVALMTGLGAKPAGITAALGPAIGPCCYEVGPEISRQFEARFGREAVQGESVDLAAAAIIDLKKTGLAPANIHLLDICTCCDKDFFSYRRDGTTGRHAAVAWISR